MRIPMPAAAVLAAAVLAVSCSVGPLYSAGQFPEDAMDEAVRINTLSGVCTAGPRESVGPAVLASDQGDRHELDRYLLALTSGDQAELAMRVLKADELLGIDRHSPALFRRVLWLALQDQRCLSAPD